MLFFCYRILTNVLLVTFIIVRTKYSRILKNKASKMWKYVFFRYMILFTNIIFIIIYLFILLSITLLHYFSHFIVILRFLFPLSRHVSFLSSHHIIYFHRHVMHHTLIFSSP